MTLDDSTLYTRFVRLSASKRELDPDMVDQVFTALQKDLMTELKRRGLIKLHPQHLGLVGQSLWDPEVKMELTQSCYVYIFGKRLDRLRARAKSHPIEPIIRLNVRNFLFDLRKKRDPVGFKLYEIVCEAAKMAVEGGKLHSIEEDDIKKAKDEMSEPSKINMSTFFETPILSRQSTMEAAGIRDIVASWESQFIRELATGFRESKSASVVELAKRLGRLGDEGVGRFLLNDIFVPLAEAVRALRNSDMSFEESATRQASNPERRAIDHDFMDKFSSCVLERTKPILVSDDQYLARLWGLLKRELFSELAAGRGLESSPGILFSGGTKVSHSRLASVMDVSRQKLRALMEELRGIASICIKMISRLEVGELDGRSDQPRPERAVGENEE